MTGHAPVATATLDDVMTELRALRTLVERLQTRRPTSLNRADRDLLAKLLPAVGGAFGSEPFTSRDLVDAAGVRVVVRGLTVKQIGQLLGRGAGTPINGLVIERAAMS
jgi:hypothetical protein